MALKTDGKAVVNIVRSTLALQFDMISFDFDAAIAMANAKATVTLHE
jgi:hypothetical protein